MDTGSTRGAVLVTGASRRAGIAAAVARRLARDGWSVAATGWRPHDAEEPGGSRAEEAPALVVELREPGADASFHEDDLRDPAAPERVLDFAEAAVGSLDALVVAHTRSRPGGLLETSVEEWGRHMEVNARGAFLLFAEFARRWRGKPRGRVVAFTSALPRTPSIPGRRTPAGSRGAPGSRSSSVRRAPRAPRAPGGCRRARRFPPLAGRRLDHRPGAPLRRGVRLDPDVPARSRALVTRS